MVKTVEMLDSEDSVVGQNAFTVFTCSGKTCTRLRVSGSVISADVARDFSVHAKRFHNSNGFF